jgi:hypothetical protein
MIARSPPGAARRLVQAHAGVVEDEQAIVKQLLGQRLAARRIEGLRQARQGAAEPATEQRILLRIERGHEQPFEPGHIQRVALHELRPEHHGDFLVVLGVIQMLRLSPLSTYSALSLRSKQNASEPCGALKFCSTRVFMCSS